MEIRSRGAEMTDEMLYIVLPIVLFLINLIITLILRKTDNIKRGLTNIRRLTDNYRNEIDNKTSAFHSVLGEIEERFSKQESEVQSLLTTAGNEINNIKSYNEDLASLRQSMDSYRSALAGLNNLTTSADTKISQIEKDVEKLELVENKIKSFQIDIKDAEEYLAHHENTIIQLQKDTVKQLEDSVSSFKIQADKILKESKDVILLYNNELEAKAEALHKASLEIDSSSEKMLSVIGDRSREQQVLSNQINNLTQTRDELNRKIREINLEIEEKKAFANQLEDMTRSENLHLAKLKENVKQYQNTISLYENQAKRTQEVVIEPKVEPKNEVRTEERASQAYGARYVGTSGQGATYAQSGAGSAKNYSAASNSDSGSRTVWGSGSVARNSVDSVRKADLGYSGSSGNAFSGNISDADAGSGYASSGNISGGAPKEDPYLNAGLRMTQANAKHESSDSENPDGNSNNFGNEVFRRGNSHNETGLSDSSSVGSSYGTDEVKEERPAVITFNDDFTESGFSTSGFGNQDDYKGNQIVIKDSPRQKLEYYGKEEEIVF